MLWMWLLGFAQADIDEIVVYGDRFARWDNTRWLVQTQVAFPYNQWMKAERNLETRVTHVQLETVLACDKSWQLGKHGYEVDCVLEDIALRAVEFDTPPQGLDLILEEWDALATNARLQLQVMDDGRVGNVDLEDFRSLSGSENRRTREIQETLRQFFTRIMAGFHMKLPEGRAIKQGQWTEYNSTIFRFPQTAGNMNSSQVVHQMNIYKGNVVVQSVGSGLMGLNAEEEGAQRYFRAEYNGVAVYDKDTGIMTERVWALKGHETGSSQSSMVMQQRSAYQTGGRLRKLQEGEVPTLGATMAVATPGLYSTTLPRWIDIE